MKRTVRHAAGILAVLVVMGMMGCNTHEHTFDYEKWSSDKNGHWHAATCEHTDMKADYAEHDFEITDNHNATVEKNGTYHRKCKVCDYFDDDVEIENTKTQQISVLDLCTKLKGVKYITADAGSGNGIILSENGEEANIYGVWISEGAFSENCHFPETLMEADLTGLDTSKVTDMSYMFNLCKNLMSLDLSSLDTSKVTDMSFMFAYCEELTSLDLSSFNTSKTGKMQKMFLDVQSLLLWM